MGRGGPPRTRQTLRDGLPRSDPPRPRALSLKHAHSSLLRLTLYYGLWEQIGADGRREGGLSTTRAVGGRSVGGGAGSTRSPPSVWAPFTGFGKVQALSSRPAADA